MKRIRFNLKSLLRSVSVLLVVAILGSQQPVLAASAKGHFKDVPEGHWAYEAVEKAYNAGAVNGVGGNPASGNGVFAPDNVLTYAEFATILMRAFYAESISAARPGEAWYTPYLRAAVANGVWTTDSLDIASAKAAEQINRYDMAEILVKILSDKNAALPSEDQIRSVADKIADWGEISKDPHRAYYVSRAYAAGVLSGTDSKGTFKGSAVVTRAVAAVIYSRIADRIRGSSGSFIPSKNLDSMQARLPDYAVSFYHSLEEASDNDGVNDYLIEDRYYIPGKTTGMLENDPDLYETVHTPDGVYLLAAKITGETDCVKECGELRRAFDLFSIDHPEVFWVCGHGDLVFVDIIAASAGNKTHYIFLCLNALQDADVDVRAGYTEQTIRTGISQINSSINAIMSGMPEGGAAEKVKYFNNWLTTHNDYNTESPAPLVSNRSISALLGSIGPDGPVCVGYSVGLKVLCDKAGIPCLIVIGTVGNAFHAWNQVQIGQQWYAVDSTWNDPAVADQNGNRIIKPATGYENEDYLLVGKNTANKNGESFEKSHDLDQVHYPLKPEFALSAEAYLWEQQIFGAHR